MPKKIPSAENTEATLQNAAVLKRVDLDDPEIKNIPPPFGNNFYLLFKARKVRNLCPNGAMVRIYLGRAEAIGEPWQHFLAENTRLLAELDEALAEEDIYASVIRLFFDFYAAGDFKGGDEYNKRIHPELGIATIGIPIWRRLNELLQQVADAMNKAGIDPKQFYG